MIGGTTQLRRASRRAINALYGARAQANACAPRLHSCCRFPQCHRLHGSEAAASRTPDENALRRKVWRRRGPHAPPRPEGAASVMGPPGRSSPLLLTSHSALIRHPVADPSPASQIAKRGRGHPTVPGIDPSINTFCHWRRRP